VMELLNDGGGATMTPNLPPMVPSYGVTKSAASAPSASLANAKAGTVVKVGNRLVSSSQPARKWVWAPFSSSARTDGALFCHWVRATVEYPDYPYARFDVHLDGLSYKDTAEYQARLQDPDWTQTETDALLDMARTFELRWAVIYDRWTGKFPLTTHTLPDLQHRYYAIGSILTRMRTQQAAAALAKGELITPTGAPPTPAEEEAAAAERAVASDIAKTSSTQSKYQPLIATLGTGTTNKEVFHLRQEKERRELLDLQWKRSKEEEREEMELRTELKLVEAQIRKLKKNGGHILAAAAGGGASRSNSPIPYTTGAGLGAGSGTVGEAQQEQDALQWLEQSFASTAPTPTPGVPYLQSGRLAAPATGGPMGLNKTLLKRMDLVLKELGVPPERPIPTKRICDMYDAVRKNVLTLLTLQKLCLKREADLRARRTKLATLGVLHSTQNTATTSINPLTPSAGATTASTTSSGTVATPGTIMGTASGTPVTASSTRTPVPTGSSRVTVGGSSGGTTKTKKKSSSSSSKKKSTSKPKSGETTTKKKGTKRKKPPSNPATAAAPTNTAAPTPASVTAPATATGSAIATPSTATTTSISDAASSSKPPKKKARES
jgi:DNA methyltransferase 1-associated protein 1